MSKMLDAFLKQTKINDSDADRREEAELSASQRRVEDGIRMMNRSQSIQDYVKIPSRGIDNTPPKIERHPSLKNYDHSLETSRWKLIGGKRANDGIGMEPVD